MIFLVCCRGRWTTASTFRNNWRSVARSALPAHLQEAAKWWHHRRLTKCPNISGKKRLKLDFRSVILDFFFLSLFCLLRVDRSGAVSRGVVSWTCDPVLALGQRFDSHSCFYSAAAVGPCGRWLWMTVHQHTREGNSLKPTKMCSPKTHCGC